MLWLAAGAIATAVTPSSVHEDEERAVALITRSALKALGYSALTAVAVGLAAPSVIPLSLGHAFKGAARPLWFLLPGVVAYAPVTVLVVYLSVRRGRPMLSLAVSIVGMVVTLAAAVLLIPGHGAVGAALASTLGYAAGAALAWTFLVRLAQSPPETAAAG